MKKECSHLWEFLERWFPANSKEPTEYVFYCKKCLKLKNIRIEFKKKKVKE